MLFSLSTIWFNMRLYQSTKIDLSILMYLKSCTEKSMTKFKLVEADKLKPYITGSIDADNQYLYHFIRYRGSIFSMGGGQKSI